MKTVKVKNVVLGEGKPKICIPLVDATRKGLADSARRVLAYRGNRRGHPDPQKHSGRFPDSLYHAHRPGGRHVRTDRRGV